MKKRIILLAATTALMTNSTIANTKWSAGLNVGTLGFGGNVAYKFNESFKIRGVINYLRLTKSFTDDDLRNDLSLRLFTPGIMGDWHVFQNGFRLTGGLVYNGNRLSMKSTPTQNVRINGRTYTPAQLGEIRGTLKFRPIAPYVGIGYDSGHACQTGFSFNADIGVLFQGKVRGRIDSLSGQLANQAQAINDAKDDIVHAANSLWWIKSYPVVSLGISYKF